MINRLSVGVICFLSGASSVVVPPLVSERVAALASQYLYDCGLRLASGTTIISIEGLVTSGHRSAVCIDDGLPRIVLDNVEMDSPTTGHVTIDHHTYEPGERIP